MFAFIFLGIIAAQEFLMLEYQYHPPSPVGKQHIPIAATPTPVPDFAVVPTEAPTGWVMAGFLALLLLIMLYKNIKRFIIGLFKKKSSN
jgi:hypothetical protein